MDKIGPATSWHSGSLQEGEARSLVVAADPFEEDAVALRDGYFTDEDLLLERAELAARESHFAAWRFSRSAFSA